MSVETIHFMCPTSACEAGPERERDEKQTNGLNTAGTRSFWFLMHDEGYLVSAVGLVTTMYCLLMIQRF